MKHLKKKVKDIDYPAIESSDKTIQAYKKAKDEEKRCKLKPVEDIDMFFNEL